jgi:esterase/lipase
MGGALAVQIAARYSDLPALGLAAPYLEMPGRIARAARLSHLWGPVVPLVASTEGRSILDPAEQDKNLAYGVFTAAALRALHDTVQRAADSLPRVVAPTLVVQSREDNRISVAAAERAFARIGAKQKRLEWLTGASHVITVDFGRERVFEMLASWMDEHRGAAATR